MADIRPAKTISGDPPQCQYYTVGKSMTIKQGDPLVLWTEATTSYRVACTITTEQIGDTYYNSSNENCGVLGFAAHDITSDSSGNCLAQIVPSAVAAAVIPITPIPQYTAGVPVDGIGSRYKLGVWLANNDTEFKMRLTNEGSAVTVTEAYVGTAVGLYVTGTTWSASTGATTKVGVITKVYPNDPNYNTSSAICHVAVKIMPGYQQVALGTLQDQTGP